MGNVAKSQTSDSLIGRINAYDSDTSQTLTYRIVDGNEENLFVLDENTGLLYWKNKPVEPTQPKTYVLTVEVTDSGTPPLSSKAECTIYHIPKFKTLQ
jgi:hypothetical protein